MNMYGFQLSVSQRISILSHSVLFMHYLFFEYGLYMSYIQKLRQVKVSAIIEGEGRPAHYARSPFRVCYAIAYQNCTIVE